MRSCYVTSVFCDDEGAYFVRIHAQLEKALGFEPDSEVYFSWLERETKIKGEMVSRPELIVTSISPDDWSDLYHLEFCLGDELGSLASIAAILEENGINVFIAQLRTAVRGGRAKWTVYADFSRFEKNPKELDNILRKEIDSNPNEDRRKYLEKRILISIDRKGKEHYVQIKRSGFYQKLKELRRQMRSIPYQQRSAFIRPRKIGDEEVDTLEIPQWVVGRLSDRFHTYPQNIDVVVMIADTEQATLSLWFPHPMEKIAKISLEIDYGPRSLSEIAQFLADMGVDLLESELNMLVSRFRGVWKMIANINGKPESPCVYSDCRSIEEFEKRLDRDIRKAGIKAFRKIYSIEEVGVWAKKPIWNLPPEREIAIERGQWEKSEKFLQKYFNSFTSNVRAILPYIDKTTFDYLDQIPKCCGISVITSLIKDRKGCLRKADKLAEDRPFVEILEVTVKTEEDHYVPLEHTRWICDENLFIILDTDLKKSALGGKDYSIEVKEASRCNRRIQKFEKRWNLSRSELEEEFRTTVVRKFFYCSGTRSL